MRRIVLQLDLGQRQRQ